MTIELLGDNCRTCRLLKKNIEVALQSVRARVEIQNVEEPQKFAEYGLLSLPGLAINGVVKTQGRLLTVREIVALVS